MKTDCRYCKKNVDIEFSEPKRDKAGRITQKGVCPNCSKTNIKYTRREQPTEEEEVEVIDPEEAYRDQLPPGEPIEDLPEAIQEPPEEEPEEVITPENQELIVEGEEAKTVVEDPAEKKLKQYQIGLFILTAFLIASVIINLWLMFKKEEVLHGNKET